MAHKNWLIDLNFSYSTQFKPKSKGFYIQFQKEGIFSSDRSAWNIYFGVATRDGEGGEKQNVLQFPAVWADFDEPLEAFQRKMDGIPEPSALVKSGGGCHAYWLIKERIKIDKIGPIL